MIHASWPVLHAPSFFEDLYKWSDPSCGMLVVAMCMLASRYSKDVRVYADASESVSLPHLPRRSRVTHSQRTRRRLADTSIPSSSGLHAMTKATDCTKSSATSSRHISSAQTTCRSLNRQCTLAYLSQNMWIWDFIGENMVRGVTAKPQECSVQRDHVRNPAGGAQGAYSPASIASVLMIADWLGDILVSSSGHHPV